MNKNQKYTDISHFLNKFTYTINVGGAKIETINWSEVGEEVCSYIYENKDDKAFLESLKEPKNKEKFSLLDTYGCNVVYSIFSRTLKNAKIPERVFALNYFLDNDIVSTLKSVGNNGIGLLFCIAPSRVTAFGDDVILKLFSKFNINDIRHSNTARKNGCPPIAFVHSLNDEKLFNLFLKAGARTDLVDSQGNTIVHRHLKEIINLSQYNDNYKPYYEKRLRSTINLFGKNLFTLYKDMLKLKNQEGESSLELLNKAIEIVETGLIAQEVSTTLLALRDKMELTKELGLLTYENKNGSDLREAVYKV